MEITPQLVTEAVRLDGEIKTRAARLAEIRAHLVAAGEGEHVGENGERAVVTQPAASLKVSAEALEAVKVLAGDKLMKLFERAQVLKPMKGLRAIARAVFPAKRAEKIIALCEVPSAPQVKYTAAA